MYARAQCVNCICSKSVPSSSIEAANSKVSTALKQGSTTGTRGPYSRYSAEKRAEIARRAAEHGVASTVHYYAGKLSDPLKESSVRTWRNAYIAELEKNKKDLKDDLIVKKLPEKKRGRPYLIGDRSGLICKPLEQMVEDSNLLASTLGQASFKSHGFC